MYPLIIVQFTQNRQYIQKDNQGEIRLGKTSTVQSRILGLLAWSDGGAEPAHLHALEFWTSAREKKTSQGAIIPPERAITTRTACEKTENTQISARSSRSETMQVTGELF